MERGYQMSDNCTVDSRQRTPHASYTNPCPPQMCKSNVDNDKTGTRTVTIQSMSHTLLLTDPPVASKLLTQCPGSLSSLAGTTVRSHSHKTLTQFS